MQPLRILITGGTKGIGESLVRVSRRIGHQVVFTGRDEAAMTALADATGAHGLRADVSSEADNARTVEFAVEKMGGVDVLVNNAAVGYWGEIGAIDMAEVRRLFDVNLFGLIDLTNRVVPLFKKQNRGDIVNVASTSGMKGHERGTAYAGSKWALRGASQCWQAELRRHNVRVICVCPSEVQTGFGGEEPGKKPNKLFADDIAGSIVGCLSMDRRGFIPEFAVFATNPW